MTAFSITASLMLAAIRGEMQYRTNFLLMAAVIAGLLLGKERVLRSRAAIAVNVSTAIIATLLGVGMLVAVIMPLIMIGKSIAGE